MKKTNFTSFYDSCWLREGLTRFGAAWKMLQMFAFVVLGALSASAQVGPNCTHINASVGSDDTARILVREFVTNADQIRAQGDSLDIEIVGSYGQRILYMENIGADYELTLYACPYIGRQLTINVSLSSGSSTSGTCWSYLTFKQYNAPVIMGTSYTLYCLDPAVTLTPDDIGYPLPVPFAQIPCQALDEEADYVADWLMYVNNSCDSLGTAAEDTVKIVLREFEAYSKDGHRGVGYDTLYVLRLPQITLMNTYCAERDTIYCADEKIGPYMVVEDLRPSSEEQANGDMCDTICFISDYIDPKCGISVNVEVADFEDHGCMQQTRYTVSIKQSCYGAPPMTTCMVPTMGNVLDSIGVGYWECTFWLINLDTVPPLVECALDEKANADLIHEDTLYIPAGSHDCAAHSYVPPAYVHDTCAGVKFVKAIIPGIATVVLEQSEDDHYLYESHKQVKIPHGLPVPIYYEAYDSCHNIGYDTCWVKVKDLTKPVTVCDKGVTVSLSGKKVWVDAETFNEGSWDNCGINLLLARRKDWTEACVDLCDDYHVACYNDHYDTLWCADLEDNKHIDEVEAHYYKTMQWLKEDGRECSELLWNAWVYDLCKYYMLNCVDHPYEVDEHYFNKLLKEFGCYAEFEGVTNITDEHIDMWSQLGGGWSDAVPFDCDDACSNVEVELLAIDYWCNWSKSWTTVRVEDKTPVDIEYDVHDELEISCSGYKANMYEYAESAHPVSIEYLVNAAKEGDKEALAELDTLFGGYDKVWRDEYGNTPDHTEGGYYDIHCYCDTYTKKTKVYDDHLGYIWKEVEYDSCYSYEHEYETYFGQVVVNCGQAVKCEQKVWCEFDHCGQGYIYREWKFIQGCPEGSEDHYYPSHHADTIKRKQIIWVGSGCELQKGMFYKPFVDEVVTCGIEYDEAGNATGDLSPEYTGYPEYMFDDDCRIVGINYSDKVFKIVGGDEACYKIIRTWYFMDWCYLGGKPENSAYWWLDPEYDGKVIEWEQKIIVKDTIPPVCTFEEELETVDAAGCYYTLDQTVYVNDSCGALSYYWELFELKGDDKETVETGEGELDGSIMASFDVVVDGLGTGSYQLKVRVTDECQNESYCIDYFDVEAGKKPSAICITSLTAELNPMDLDEDGEVDTAMVTIWANEFDRSSAPACGSDNELYFRIEVIDGVDDDTWTEDADSLVLGCEHFGTQPIRLWVIDESGSYDFCDVMLVVQNNMGGCPDVSANNNTISGSIQTELQQSIKEVRVQAQLENGQVLDYLTTASGAYAFAAALGQKVTVKPTKDVYDINGISTLDLIKMQKHILSKEKLENAYREIAADVNNDGKISTLDLVQLRKLILGKIDKLPDNTSWRFFDRMSNKEQYEISPVQSAMQLDWVGVKTGDVNLDADPSRSAGRSANHLVFDVEDVKLNAGTQYMVNFRAGNFNEIAGYQYTLSFDPAAMKVVNVIGAEALSLTDDHFALNRMNEGVITSSWNAAEARTVEAGEVIFTLVVEASRDVQLSDVMTVNSKVTKAEAYNSLEQVSNVALSFTNSGIATNEFALFQNSPNPFTEVTKIGFNLPQADAATLTVYDVTGKVMHTQDGEFSRGYNEFEVKQRDLTTTGVLYYQLDTDAFTATKKMIHIR